ncbi:coiled-coil domain-containing protein 102B [Pogoniulus pusillus]|uniref:coiled-coil domain-containing protein 102B n=1 Tax=Pogoniulus pusillus TaxID=488313 RepID=UPI0030B922C9
MNQKMNLGSAQEQMEETWLWGTQPKQPSKPAGGCQPGAHLCHSNLPPPSFCPFSSHCPHMSDWDIFEAVRVQELNEVKARAAQMEKTMRWWSDCTANWREKWSKVRGERNQAREEARQLRIKLDSVLKELRVLKKVNQGLVSEREKLEGVAAWRTELSCSERACVKEDLNWLTLLEREPVQESKANETAGAEHTKKGAEVIQDPRNANTKISAKPPASLPRGDPRVYLEEPGRGLDSRAETPEDDFIHISVLHLHLAEVQKVLQKEREMNVLLEREMEKLENELFLWKWNYEELRQAKLESLKQLERVQLENSSDWGRREKHGAEKQSLEEENRRLKLQGKEVEESQLRIWEQTKLFACCWRVHGDKE